MYANGDDASDANDAGAGGTIILYAEQIASTLAIQAEGGNGGDAEQVGTIPDPINNPTVFQSIGCFGPGGGGGGGMVWIYGTTVPNGVSVVKGEAGVITLFANTTSTYAGCILGNERGAEDGKDGAVLKNLLLPGDPLP